MRNTRGKVTRRAGRLQIEEEWKRRARKRRADWCTTAQNRDRPRIQWSEKKTVCGNTIVGVAQSERRCSLGRHVCNLEWHMFDFSFFTLGAYGKCHLFIFCVFFFTIVSSVLCFFSVSFCLFRFFDLAFGSRLIVWSCVRYVLPTLCLCPLFGVVFFRRKQWYVVGLIAQLWPTSIYWCDAFADVVGIVRVQFDGQIRVIQFSLAAHQDHGVTSRIFFLFLQMLDFSRDVRVE